MICNECELPSNVIHNYDCEYCVVALLRELDRKLQTVLCFFFL